MLGIYTNATVDSLSQLSLDRGLSENVDFRRVRFEVYLTLSYIGFFNETQLTHDNLIESIPKEYLPCDIEQAETFHLTSTTVARIIKKHTSFIKGELSISPKDLSSLTLVHKNLPLTMQQANKDLVQSGVIANYISPRAMEFLFDLFIDGCDVKVSIIFKSMKNADEDGNRFERNTRPSIKVISESKDTKALKQLSPFIVRCCDTVGRLIAVVPYTLVGKIVSEYQSELVSSLFTTPKSFSDYCHSLCGEKYQGGEGNVSVHEDLPESDAYILLWQYLSTVSTLRVKDVHSFLIRVIRYKANNSRRRGSSSKLISTLAIANVISHDDISDVSINMLLSAINFIEVKGDVVCLKEDEFFDVEGIDNITIHTILDYLHKHKHFSKKHSKSDIASELQNHFAEIMKSKLVSAIDSPQGFFGIEGDTFFITSEHKTYKENHSGNCVRPDYDLISDELFNETTLFKQELIGMKSKYALHFEAFKEKWSSYVFSSALLVDDTHKDHEEYIADRFEILLGTDYRSCQMWLVSEKKRVLRLMESYTQCLSYYETIDDSSSYARTIEHVKKRMTKWEKVLSHLGEELIMITSSDSYRLYQTHEKNVADLIESRSKLQIKPSQYKAHILIHNFIARTGKVTRADVKAYIEKYSQYLVGNFTDDSEASERNDYYNRISLFKAYVDAHPFVLIEGR